jgi:hypothetical protein
MEFATIIGSLGVGILLVAFILNISKIINENSYFYFTANFVGAGLACYSSILINFLPFVILELVWCLVALMAIIGKMMKRK